VLIIVDQQIMEKKGLQTMKRIDDEILLEHEKALADAHHYQLVQDAEGNKALLTPEYLTLQAISSIAQDTKIYFGKDISSMYQDFVTNIGEFVKKGK